LLDASQTTETLLKHSKISTTVGKRSALRGHWQETRFERRCRFLSAAAKSVLYKTRQSFDRADTASLWAQANGFWSRENHVILVRDPRYSVSYVRLLCRLTVGGASAAKPKSIRHIYRHYTHNRFRKLTWIGTTLLQSFTNGFSAR